MINIYCGSTEFLNFKMETEIMVKDELDDSNEDEEELEEEVDEND